MEKQVIVEIAMEIALMPEVLGCIEKRMGMYAAVRSAMGTSVGGIGPLLRDRIPALQAMGQDVYGVTLLYDKVWIQRWHAWGQFYLERGESAVYVKPVLKKLDMPVEVTMPSGRKENACVWEAAYGRSKVYFLENKNIANIVYPGPEDAPTAEKDAGQWAQRARINQSWFLGRGSLALLKMLGIKPGTVILSETPAIFALHKIVKDGLDAESAFRGTKYIFNDHTPLEYAHPVWPEGLMKELKIKDKYYKNLQSYKNNPEKIDVTQLIIDCADKVYGVSKKHGDVMRSMPTLSRYAEKIKTITNGVSRDIWQAEPFRQYKRLSGKAVLEIKEKQKDALVDWMWNRFKFSSSLRAEKKKSPLVMWMRRVTGYKRLDILKEIIISEELRRRFVSIDITVLLGGRIHQTDSYSDWVVFELLDIIQKYPELEGRLILLDNFNVWEAPMLYHGVDAAVMISNAGREASATGFMKAQLNAAMIIATEDGAIPESVYFYGTGEEGTVPNGFKVEYTNGEPTPHSLLKAFEEFRGVYNDISLRKKMMCSALAQSENISIERTAEEMLSLINSR